MKLVLQRRLAARLAGEIACVVVGGQKWVGRGVPLLVVDPVQDPPQARAPRAEHPVEAFAELGSLDLARVARAHRRGRVGEQYPRLQEVDLPVELEELGREVTRLEVQEVPVPARETALIREVVDREHRAQSPEL